MTKKVALGIASVAVFWAAVAGAVIVFAGSGEDRAPASPPATSQPDPGHGPDLDGVRTLLVSTTGSEVISTPEGPLHASLLEGEMAVGPTMATVLTDENCTPDAEGISHCRNALQLSDGTPMAVRHNHRMADVACLSPGEQVMVIPA